MIQAFKFLIPLMVVGLASVVPALAVARRLDPFSRKGLLIPILIVAIGALLGGAIGAWWSDPIEVVRDEAVC